MKNCPDCKAKDKALLLIDTMTASQPADLLYGFIYRTAHAALPAQARTEGEASKKFIDDLVDRFLRWPLPESVCADPCATKQGPGRVGTNLLSAIEARQMFEDLLGGECGHICNDGICRECGRTVMSDNGPCCFTGCEKCQGPDKPSLPSPADERTKCASTIGKGDLRVECELPAEHQGPHTGKPAAPAEKRYTLTVCTLVYGCGLPDGHDGPHHTPAEKECRRCGKMKSGPHTCKPKGGA